jgi:hypothetical protein
VILNLRGESYFEDATREVRLELHESVEGVYECEQGDFCGDPSKGV